MIRRIKLCDIIPGQAYTAYDGYGNQKYKFAIEDVRHCPVLSYNAEIQMWISVAGVPALSAITVMEDCARYFGPLLQWSSLTGTLAGGSGLQFEYADELMVQTNHIWPQFKHGLANVYNTRADLNHEDVKVAQIMTAHTNTPGCKYTGLFEITKVDSPHPGRIDISYDVWDATGVCTKHTKTGGYKDPFVGVPVVLLRDHPLKPAAPYITPQLQAHLIAAQAAVPTAAQALQITLGGQPIAGLPQNGSISAIPEPKLVRQTLKSACECGVSKVGGIHSDWCPMGKK